MRKYETIVAIHPDNARENLEAEVEKIKSILVENSASEIEVEDWGRKEFPHLAKKQSWGHYICFIYQTDNYQLQKELTGILRISDGVLKFQSHAIFDKSRKFKGNPLLLKGGKVPAYENGEAL